MSVKFAIDPQLAVVLYSKILISTGSNNPSERKEKKMAWNTQLNLSHAALSVDCTIYCPLGRKKATSFYLLKPNASVRDVVINVTSDCEVYKGKMKKIIEIKVVIKSL